MEEQGKKYSVFLLSFLFGLFLIIPFLSPPASVQAAATKYDIQNSVSLASASSQYLTWTPTILQGSSTIWTFSTWVKRASTGTAQKIFSAGKNTTYFFSLGFNASDQLVAVTNANDCQTTGAITAMNKVTTATYTSTTAWYHIVFAVDTSQATAANREKLYVNGTQVTVFTTNTDITQNAHTCVTLGGDTVGTINGGEHRIGRDTGTNTNYFNGNLAETILVDGVQLDSSSFAFSDGGVWTPLEFTGTTARTSGPYGTNGFRLDYASSTLLGFDRSGKKHNFTTSGSPTQSATTPTGQLTTNAANSAPAGQTLITVPTLINGALSIVYNLSKGSGTFVIDDPLDPQNKLLYHSFVESPDAKNIYDGIAPLDTKGQATIMLPGYFMALNKDFRYLATPLGQPMPNLFLSEEVHPYYFGLFGSPAFTIKGGVPNGRVSWQVTGVRHDIYIQQNPSKTIVDKGPDELVPKGTFLYPDLYNADGSLKTK